MENIMIRAAKLLGSSLPKNGSSDRAGAGGAWRCTCASAVIAGAWPVSYI